MHRIALSAVLAIVVAPAVAQTTNYDVIPLGMSITGPEQLTFGVWFFDYEKGRAFSCAVTRTPTDLSGICHDQTPDKGSMLTGPNVRSGIPQLSPSSDASIGGVSRSTGSVATSSSATFQTADALRSRPSNKLRVNVRSAPQKDLTLAGFARGQTCGELPTW